MIPQCDASLASDTQTPITKEARHKAADELRDLATRVERDLRTPEGVPPKDPLLESAATFTQNQLLLMAETLEDPEKDRPIVMKHAAQLPHRITLCCTELERFRRIDPYRDQAVEVWGKYFGELKRFL